MANPALTVDDSNYPTQGYVRLSWTNATKGSDWYAWRVYRRPNTASGKWEMVKEILYDIVSYQWDDYTVANNIEYEYVVVRTYLVALVPTEEAKTPVVEVTPTGDNYWLIHPYNPALNALLHQVTGDQYAYEAEAGEMNILERGRRVDFGSTWGRRGTLTAQLRDKTSIAAATQLELMQAQSQARTFFWLRTPFGQMFRVVLSGLSVTRVPGVGVREFTDIAFSYAEVTA